MASITDSELFTILMDNLAGAVYFKDERSCYIKINRVMAGWLGLADPEQAVGKSDFDFFSEEYARETYSDEQELLASGHSLINQEKAAAGLNGKVSWISRTIMPLRSRNGKIAGTVGILWDITDRKQAETALRQSEQKLRAIIEAARDAIIVVDMEGVVIDANSTGIELSGYKPEEIIGKNALQFVSERDRERVAQDIGNALAQGELLPLSRYQFVNARGETIEIESSNGFLYNDSGNPIALVGVLRDISETKAAQEVIKRSEEKYRSLVENIDDMLFTLDADGCFTYVSPSIRKVAGYDPREIVGSHFVFFLHPDDQDEALANFELSVEGDTHPLIFRGIAKDGTAKHMRISVKFHMESGKFTGITGVMSDVTDLIETEMALRDSQEKLRAMFESMQDGVSVSDLEGIIVDANEAAVRIAGLNSREEALGINGIEFISEKDRPRAIEDMVTAFKEGRSGILEYEMVNRQGKNSDIEVAVNFIYDHSGNPKGYVSVVRDITERKQAEEELQSAHRELKQAHEELKSSQEQLLQSAKMAAVGQLVSGVAHEVNNPLMAISGYVEILLKKTPDEAILKRLQRVFDETQRAIGIVSNLLSFARKKDREKTLIGINEAIDSVIQLRAYDMSLEGVEIESDLGPDLPDVLADFQQIQQVILNLLINAEQAIKRCSEEGKVIIRTELIDSVIRITVQDNGPGMSGDVRQRAFEPFFTTKGVGEGTGLGLSICYNIIREHGGRILIDSVEGEGTLFTIELPVADPAAIVTTSDN